MQQCIIIIVIMFMMCIIGTFIPAQGHVFAMEISSGEEFYIACDNTGTPLAVFSNNGLLLKQVCVCVRVCLFKFCVSSLRLVL